MAVQSIRRYAGAVSGVLGAVFVLWLTPALICAQEPVEGDTAPFDYAWEVRFREEAIGYSLSRFCFIDEGGERGLCADGYRSFAFEIGPVSIHVTEQTRVMWDDRGDMRELEARTAVGDDITITRALRTADGVSIVKKTEKREKEHLFTSDEYDHTDVDRFLHTLDGLSDKKTYRILSISEDKVKSISYEYLGASDFFVSGMELVCHRIGFEGPRSTGEMLVDGLGIPVSFSMDTVLGSFTFVPCDPALAEESLFSTEPDFLNVP